MATLSGHMTKLDAVNSILASIGEAPVNSLSSGLPDAELAESFLDRENRRVQLMGWHCNTLNDYELTKNVSNQFPVPDDTLKCDTVNPRGPRKGATPKPHSYINATMRRAADDSKWLMWDGDNNSETWATETTLTVDLVQLIQFSNLTPALQIYVHASAAHKFQKSTMGSQVLRAFTEEDVKEAEVIAINEDMENEDLNIIRDNSHVHSIAFRNNPLFGR
jgi:hypothetical protein